MNYKNNIKKINDKLDLVYETAYDKGYEVGYGESYDKGFDKGFIDGQQAEYDKFWDNFQENGNRANYANAFINNGWNNETFNPKYPISPTADASYAFDNIGLTDFDFVEKGIVLDLRNATLVTYMFRNAKGVKRIGVFDCYASRKNINRPFYKSNIETIDEFVFYEDSVYNATFSAVDKLKNLTCSGVIASNDLTFVTCTLLSKNSLTSVINCLSTTTSGLSVTLSLTAVNKAFETSENAKDGSNSTEWQTLVNTKQN